MVPFWVLPSNTGIALIFIVLALNIITLVIPTIPVFFFFIYFS